MAIVNLCSACRDGQHDLCESGCGQGQMVFCCTCAICAESRPLKEFKKKAQEIINNLGLNVDKVQTTAELHQKLCLEAQRLGNEILLPQNYGFGD